MIEEIINVCKKIKSISKCSACGGSIKQDTCIFCGTKNNELTELISRLNSLINSFRSQVDISNIIVTNNLFNHLYSINNLEIQSVNKLLSDVNYHNLLEEQFQVITKKINNGDKLLQEDYDFLCFFLINNQFKDSLKLGVVNVLIKGIVNKECNFDISSLEEIVKTFVEEGIKNVIGLKYTHCKIVEYDDKRTCGSALYGNVYVNKAQIRHLADGKLTYLLRTLFHEMIHVRQYQRRKDRCISIYDMILLKDKILSDASRKYYDDNYFLLSIENQAFMNESKETLDYMEKLEITPSKEELDDINKDYEYHKNFCGATIRIWEDVPCELDTLFDKSIYNSPSVLNQYPQLSLEYIIDENIVRRKTRKEIESEYEDYLEGRLQLNGNPEEIEDYFNFLLSRTKENIIK